jgi:hypothetical protein
MTKTLVATHTHTDPLWRSWSRQVAYAESLAVGSAAEVAAWAKADQLYNDWQTAVSAANGADTAYVAENALQRDLDATQDAAAGRYGY